VGDVEIILYSTSIDGTRVKLRKIGNTTYTVTSVFNKRSEINVLHKLNRLMERDAENFGKTSGISNQSVV